MRLKILFPEKASELNLDEPAWQEMKDELENYRNNKNWWGFAGRAMHLKILAAHKAEATDQGLELTMQKPKDFKQEKKERPIRKAF